MIKKLLVLSLLVALIFAIPGGDVTCNSATDSTTCGSAGASTWTKGSRGRFQITECDNIGNSFSNIYDTFCSSCGEINNSFVNSSQNGCTTTPFTGTNVACQQGGDCSTTTCGTLPSLAFEWERVPNTNYCVIVSCLAAPMPNSSLTDNFCNSCQKTNKFANSYGSACVNPANGNCTRKTNWTDDDCKLCNAGGNNSANIKASSDKTSCIAASSSSSSSVIAVSALLVASLLI